MLWLAAHAHVHAIGTSHPGDEELGPPAFAYRESIAMGGVG